MRVALTKQQNAMLRAIKDLTVDGVSPSYDELAVHLRLHSKGAVAYLLTILKQKGRIAWEPNRARSIRVLDVGEAAGETDMSIPRLAAIIEDAARQLAERIGPSEAADLVAKTLRRLRDEARTSPDSRAGRERGPIPQ